MKILVQTFFAMFSKSADYGARFYVSAARASKEQHVSHVNLCLASRHAIY